MTIEFTAFPRATEGRGASRRMRRGGKAPGIVYGGVADSVQKGLDGIDQAFAQSPYLTTDK